jgi:hypothetical protein
MQSFLSYVLYCRLRDIAFRAIGSIHQLSPRLPIYETILRGLEAFSVSNSQLTPRHVGSGGCFTERFTPK